MSYIKDTRRAIRPSQVGRKATIMSKYQVELQSGAVIAVPADKAKTRYEYISKYGMQAVLERARRSRAYKAANQTTDDLIRAVITPTGERVTQL